MDLTMSISVPCWMYVLGELLELITNTQGGELKAINYYCKTD